jgi:hypothetical protein
MKNILAENLLRFSPKNLTESEKKKIQEQAGSQFTYSQNPNPEEADQENGAAYQQYLGSTGTMDNLVGKLAILYKTTSAITKKPSMFKQNEYTSFIIDGYEVKQNPTQQIANIYLYSNNTDKVKAPFIRIADVPNTNYMAYYTAFNASPIRVYNEVLRLAVLDRAKPERQETNPLYPNK